MKGKVLQSTGSWYKIQCEDGHQRDARLKGKFKTAGLRFTNPVAVGDDVILHTDADEHGLVITEVLARSNYIVRQSPRKKFHQHIIAANIDQALLIVSIRQPRTSLGFIDRFIIAAESFHIPVVIMINKVDLHRAKDEEVMKEWVHTYSSIGYPVHLTSIESGEGLEAVHQILKDKVTLVAGHSGVGKSSFINQLDRDLDIRVNAISDKYSKGRHTTTFATMHLLDDNIYIIDTPGIKEFGLSQIEPEELSGYFKEMNALTGSCKFNNCLHRDEPGCVIKEAVVRGDIAESRFMNYLQMLDSLEEVNSWERN